MPKINSILIPEGLVQSVREQRVVLFIGAGASLEASSPDGTSRPPTAAQLRALIGQKFFANEMTGRDLATVAELAIENHGDALVFDYIREVFAPFQPSAAHRLLPSFRWRAIATTNYDLLVDLAYAEASDRLQTLIPFVKDREPVEERMQRSQSPLQYLKLHGCLNHIFDQEIPLVLSHEHYSRHSKHRVRLFDRLKGLAYESTFVFCGYGMGDSHVRNIIYDLAREGIARPRYYLVDPAVEEVDQVSWMSRNVDTVKATFGEFVEALNEAIPVGSRRLTHSAFSEALPIARHFKTNSQPTETLRTSLARDLTHVHPGMAIEPQKPALFYQGFDRGWGAISSRLDVYRRQTDDVLSDAVLDPPVGPELQFFVLKGSAGSGKTVSLKRIAWEAAADYDVVCLYQIEGGVLSFDVLAEVYQLTGKRVYLFLDRVAGQADKVFAICATAKLRGLPLTLVCAERLNEWNVYCQRLEEAYDPTEIVIGNLSTGEVEGLLDLLGRHKALGLLAKVSRDDQVKAFTERAERQLLVALHETTLGKPFEEIVFDEFKALVPEQAKQLYLDICTMHQYGVTARAGTISRVSGIRFSEYESKFLKPLENVVLSNKNPRTQDEHYQARHSRIAQLVFQQACPTDELKVAQLVRIIEALDIGYATDDTVLLEITKGHKLAETLSTVEGGRAIYTAALEVAPDRAFLLQQWAIFESNHERGSLDEADRLVREAIARDNRIKSFKHTHAVICRKRALEATHQTTREQLRRLARERLDEMRSESDAYVLGVRANLAVDELIDLAESITDGSSEADLKHFQNRVRDTESLLTRAKQHHPDDAELSKCEARLSTALNQQDRAVKALEKAWRGATKGSGVAIRLARHYASQAQPERTLEYLRSALEKNQDDRQAHLEMAKHLMKTDPSNRETIGQHLARSYSKNDSNFEAQHLHAQFLFMIGKVRDAEVLFASIDRRAPNEFRRRAPKAHSIVSSSLPQFRGTVATLRATLAFITSPSYSRDIFTHASDSDLDEWSRLQAGDAVTFQIKFNRAGPIAVGLRRV